MGENNHIAETWIFRARRRALYLPGDSTTTVLGKGSILANSKLRDSYKGFLGIETKRFNQCSPLRSQTLVSYFEKPTAFQAWSKLCYYFLDVLKPPLV